VALALALALALTRGEKGQTETERLRGLGELEANLAAHHLAMGCADLGRNSSHFKQVSAQRPW
jgi:hypothetical protein